MNTFIILSEILNKHSSFEELARLLLRKNIIQIGKQVLCKYNIDQQIKVQELLSAFLINSYPSETIGISDIKDNQELIKLSGYVLYDRSDQHSNYNYYF